MIFGKVLVVKECYQDWTDCPEDDVCAVLNFGMLLKNRTTQLTRCIIWFHRQILLLTRQVVEYTTL